MHSIVQVMLNNNDNNKNRNSIEPRNWLEREAKISLEKLKSINYQI